jgi:hypothetical protein
MQLFWRETLTFSCTLFHAFSVKVCYMHVYVPCARVRIHEKYNAIELFIAFPHYVLLFHINAVAMYTHSLRYP